MKGYLTTNQIDFVMFHLDMVLDITEDIRERILFHKDGSTGNMRGNAFWRLTWFARWRSPYGPFILKDTVLDLEK